MVRMLPSVDGNITVRVFDDSEKYEESKENVSYSDFGNAEQTYLPRQYLEEKRYRPVTAFVLEKSCKEQKIALIEQKRLPVVTPERALELYLPETYEVAVSLAHGNIEI